MKRPASWFAILALIASLVMTSGIVRAPAFTDAYYHYNAAVRIARGGGLNEPYLWTYTGAPATISPDGTFPSHLYWMPMSSLMAAFGMAITGSEAFMAAQFLLSLSLWGASLIAYATARRLDAAQVRTAWYAGIIVLGGGFYARFWGTTDTFAPYALLGGGCMFVLGIGLHRLTTAQSGRATLPLWALAGGLAACAHLTRPDGLLMLLVGIALLLLGLVRSWASARMILASLALFAGLYLLVMLPWFARNLGAIGTPLPLGGTASAWFLTYDDLFVWPQTASLGKFWSAGGLGLFVQTRWEAFAGNSGLLSGNLGTFIAVEGMIVMGPLMLLGAWKRRREVFLWPFLLFAIGIHAAMTLAFPFPGVRGGLLHAASALMPFWAVLGLLGTADAVLWVAKRRRSWRPASATAFFSFALMAYTVVLSALIASRAGVPASDVMPSFYQELTALLPADARVMINDPSALYYYTGLGGAVVPASPQDVIPALAEAYDLDYVVLEQAGLTVQMAPAFESPAAFLRRLPFSDERVRVYEITSPAP
ncbi:MAG: hypothetical protein KME04_03945 [Pleurocapsa minor GSE-CHR-MK-17-07R]|jgi:hypothetical protein|nr:hypothetical protein [Pleurocapsa minor GSE-CHR-MK 17-07R]